MAESMFDGFDHTIHREEVQRRWGADAFAAGDAWWRSMSSQGKRDWSLRQAGLAAAWANAAARGITPDSEEAQGLAERQVGWLGAIPGTPGFGDGGPTREYVIGLGEMYVADDRFAANYGGLGGATFVRDAMRIYAETHL